jgi:CRISPR system Cascade subunit CasB
MPPQAESPLIAHLKALAQREDRGALAALRRGLGEPPGSCADMHPYVVPFLKPDRWTWYEQCHYIVAALFGLHPEIGGIGNMGDTFRSAVDAARSDESTERRFVALLKCHRDDLFDHLRQAVGFAKSKHACVNWDRLLRDIQRWNSDQGWVQREWARSFWGAASSQDGIENPKRGVE